MPPSPFANLWNYPIGILPRDGKNITFVELGARIRDTYNFSPSFCFFVPNYAANMIKKDYNKDTFDLVELDLHNGIEHDASLLRMYPRFSPLIPHFPMGYEANWRLLLPGEDSALVPDQSKPHVPFIRELLDSASGKDADGKPLLTIEDLSKFSAKRRVDAKETNPDFTLGRAHKTFGSTK